MPWMWWWRGFHLHGLDFVSKIQYRIMSSKRYQQILPAFPWLSLFVHTENNSWCFDVLTSMYVPCNTAYPYCICLWKNLKACRPCNALSESSFFPLWCSCYYLFQNSLINWIEGLLKWFWIMIGFMTSNQLNYNRLQFHTYTLDVYIHHFLVYCFSEKPKRSLEHSFDI